MKTKSSKPVYCLGGFDGTCIRQEIFISFGTVCSDENSQVIVSQHGNGATVHCKAVKHVNKHNMFPRKQKVDPSSYKKICCRVLAEMILLSTRNIAIEMVLLSTHNIAIEMVLLSTHNI